MDKVLNRIHQEDLLEKHLLELQYIRHLKSIPTKERSNYYMAIHLRMLDTSGNYLAIYQRIFSLNFHPGSLSLIVCFYNSSINNYIPEKPDGLIINTVDRHRQNILEKLRVKNSLEACRIAKKMGVL